MSLILSIETASHVCSVAIHERGVLVGLNELHQDNVHAKKLISLIDTLLGQTGVKGDQLEAVAVSAGPGSYTGLRIGVSVAKGLAFTYEIPLIGVDTLSALGQHALPLCAQNDHVVALMDARRMEVYAQVIDSFGKILMLSQPLILENNPFEGYQGLGKIIYVGDGVKKGLAVLAHQQAIFFPCHNSSVEVGKLAYTKFLNSHFEDLAYFEPNYLKEFRVIQSKKNPLLV